MSDDFSTSFSFDLNSNLPQVASASAQSVYELQQAMKSGTEELRGMQAALRNMKGDASQSSAVLGALRDKISAQKAALSTASAAYAQLGVSYKALKNPADELREAQEKLEKQSERAAIKLEKANAIAEKQAAVAAAKQDKQRAADAKSKEATDLAKKVELYRLLSSAALKVASATVRAAKDTISFGFASAFARREELQHLQGLTKLRYGYFALAGGFAPAADKAEFLQSNIDAVSSSVALSRDKVAQYSDELYRMGLRGGNLQAALEGVTTVAAVQGDTAAQAWKGMALGGALTGKSIKALAGDVKARLGPIAEQQMLNWNVQTMKLRENMSMVFRDLKLDKLLKGLRSVTELFGTTKAEGKAIKSILGNAFQGLADFAGGTGAHLVKNFIQDLILGALDVGIAYYQAKIALRGAFGDSGTIDLVDTLSSGVKAAAWVFEQYAWAVGAAANAYRDWAGQSTKAQEADHQKALAAGWNPKPADTAKDAAAAQGVGLNIAAGVATGIESGTPGIVGAVKKANAAALGEFKKGNEIHSPSRLFRRTAYAIPQGQALGIKDGEPLVKDAMLRLVPDAPEMRDAAQSGAQGAGAATGSGSGRPIVVQFGDIIVGSSGAKEQARDFMRQLELALSGADIQIGGVPA